MKRDYDVVALGELLIDFTSERMDENGFPTITAHPGGAPANFLCTLSKYGAKTALIGKVGQDAFGVMLKSMLERLGVDISGILETEEAFTTLAFVTLDEHGDREFSFARKPGADLMIRASEIDYEKIDKTKLFHFGTLSFTDEPARSAAVAAVKYAKQKGKLLTFDPNLRRPLWKNIKKAREWMLWGLYQADVVKLSDEEARFLFGKEEVSWEKEASFEEYCIKKLLEDFDVKLVLLTLGKDGCYYANKNAQGHVPGRTDVTAVDTTGAGDIFGGAAIFQLLQKKKPPQELSKEELEDIARISCTAAGLSTAKPGGISSIPSLEEVKKAGWQ